MFNKELDICNISTRMLKYSFLGIITSFMVYYFYKDTKNMDIDNVLMVAVISSLVYSVLDSPLFIKENYYNKNK